VLPHGGKHVVRHSVKRLVALLFLRTALVSSLQLLLALLMPWGEVRAWWPFTMVATEAVCLVVLVALLRRERQPLSSVQLRPFRSQLELGWASALLRGGRSESRLVRFLLDALLFVALLLVLGLPAAMLNGILNETIPVLRDISTVGVLPDWALYLITPLLPLAQALVEFPWFYGYVYPRLEACLQEVHGDRRTSASVVALLIVVAFFVLQAVLIPLTLDLEYVVWRAIAVAPLLLAVGVVVHGSCLVPTLCMRSWRSVLCSSTGRPGKNRRGHP